MIGLTVKEIRRMHARLCRPEHPPDHHLRWPLWRRRHPPAALASMKLSRDPPELRHRAISPR